MSVLLRQAGGFEGAGHILENLPPDDPAPAQSHYLGKPLVEWSAAASSTAPFAHRQDNAGPCVYELLRFEAVVLPRAPVATRSFDDRIAPDVHAVMVQHRSIAGVPNDVIVEQRPKGFRTFNSAANQFHVLLRHRPRSIPQAQESA